MSVPRFTVSFLPVEEARKCIYHDFTRLPAYYCSRNASSEHSLYCTEHEQEKQRLYTIEKIVGKKLELEGKHWQVYYKIKWLGYPASENTWEPKESLEKTAKETVEDYEAQYKA